MNTASEQFKAILLVVSLGMSFTVSADVVSEAVVAAKANPQNAATIAAAAASKDPGQAAAIAKAVAAVVPEAGADITTSVIAAVSK